MPSRIERDFQLTGFLMPNPPTFVRVVGSDKFISERLIGYEAGYRNVVRPQFYVDAAVFHHEHDNLPSFGAPTVAFETTPPPARLLFVFPYVNGVTGTSDGVEIAPDWRPSRMWQLKGSYSYLRINVRLKPGQTDTSAVAVYEGSSPQHQ